MRGGGVVVPTILLLLGFLVTSALLEEREREAQLPTRAAELLELIEGREAIIGELEGEFRSLSERLRRLQRADASGSSRLREALAAIERLRPLASLAAARGPGVVVELSDSETAPRTRGDLTDLRIQDVDLRLVVNAMWQAGARAVAVNGHRLTTTSAIRTAGDRILVNFDPVASPYRITALGDPETLEARLRDDPISEQFDIWTQVYGLGFEMRGSAALEVPALEAPSRLAWARPVGALA